MKRFAMIAPVLAILTCQRPAEAEQITLKIDNVQNDDQGWELTRLLARVPDVKVAQRVTKDKPIAIIAYDPAKADIGDLATAVAKYKTPGRDRPATYLVLNYKRLDSNAAADDAFMSSIVETALPNLKGVEAKGSKLDIKNKQLLIKLNPQAKTKLDDIKAAFPGLSLE
jgi:hypothetical protein